MLKLTKNTDQSIPVSQMKDGDVAVIVGWTFGMYVGRVVQRYKQYLITLGAKSDCSWGEYFGDHTPGILCRVRILEPGETLTIE